MKISTRPAAGAALRSTAAGPPTPFRKIRISAVALFWGALVFGYTLTAELYFWAEHAPQQQQEGWEGHYHSAATQHNPKLTPARILRHHQQQQQRASGTAAASGANHNSKAAEEQRQHHHSSSVPPATATNSLDHRHHNKEEEEDETVSGICAALSGRSPLQLWFDHLGQILAASQHRKLDPRHRLEPVHAAVLDRIAPRLPRSVKVLPRDDGEHGEKGGSTMVGRLLSKLERRWRYLQQEQQQQNGGRTKNNDISNEPPPLVITVLGGSVTAGANCQTGLPRLHLERCAWPARLQQLADHLFLPGLVRVEVVAAGGTNTAAGAAVLEYDLLEGPRPDVLVNAYATNDMHALTVEEARRSGMTVREKVFGMAQHFVRTAYLRHDNGNKRGGGCGNENGDDEPAPLLLYWLDDYLGNEQREILATQELAQSVDVLAQYYGFGFVSYADAVRDWVYGDTRETMFSPAGWYDGSNDGTATMRREVHPGQAMHLSVACMMLYNFLTAASEHCALQGRWRRQDDGNSSPGSDSPLQAAQRKLEDDANIQKFLPRAPGPRPPGLPPPLHANLTLDVVSAEWQRAASSSSNSDPNNLQNCTPSSSSDTVANGGDRSKPSAQRRRRCPFSWVSAMPWREKSDIEALFLPLTKNRPQQWRVHDTTSRQNKLGWMPRTGAAGEQLALHFTRREHAADNLESITFFFLKSYGEPWANSTVSIAVERQSETDHQWESALEDGDNVPHSLMGFHDKHTSETYTETVRLRPPLDPQAITAVRVTLTLVGGSAFKLMGIAACQ